MPDSTLAVERWLSIPHWAGWYEASDFGQVRSVDRYVTSCNGRICHYRSRILNPIARDSANGYVAVRLSRFGANIKYYVHSLILETFVGPRPAGMQSCHGPAGPADNHLANLRWDTPSANMFDKQRDGTDHMRNRVACQPLGHLLRAPNLVASELRKGHRGCLACSRTRANRQHAALYGHPFDFRAVAAAHYEKIMQAA